MLTVELILNCKIQVKLKKKKINQFLQYDIEHISTIGKENIGICFEGLDLIYRELEELWNGFKEVVKQEC